VALNKQVFRTRALTAVLFAVIMLAGLFINGFTFIGLMAAIIIGCCYEMMKILKLIRPGGFQLLLIPALLYIIVPIILMTDLGFLGTLLDGKRKSASFINEGYYLLLPVLVILSIWINDTMAYIVGSLIGKTPLSKISPKKTVEGTLGGILLAVLMMGLLGHFVPFIHESLDLTHVLIIAAICGIFGTLGDLLESKLKRMANLKDSGSFMPGHGGFLDRFDSLLLAAPAVWLYLRFLG
jgi:phosphatidate cytidylyltransferase